MIASKILASKKEKARWGSSELKKLFDHSFPIPNTIPKESVQPA